VQKKIKDEFRAQILYSIPKAQNVYLDKEKMISAINDATVIEESTELNFRILYDSDSEKFRDRIDRNGFHPKFSVKEITFTDDIRTQVGSMQYDIIVLSKLNQFLWGEKVSNSLKRTSGSGSAAATGSATETPKKRSQPTLLVFTLKVSEANICGRDRMSFSANTPESHDYKSIVDVWKSEPTLMKPELNMGGPTPENLLLEVSKSLYYNGLSSLNPVLVWNDKGFVSRRNKPAQQQLTKYEKYEIEKQKAAELAAEV